MAILTTDDRVLLYYELHGSGARELILLHGMGGSGATWWAVLPELDSTRWRILAIDFRGHGKSSGEPSSFSFARSCHDITAVATAAGFRHATVVGFSGGCKDATCLAAEAPSLVRDLILVAPPGLGIVPIGRDVLWPFFSELTREKKVPPVLEPWLTEKLGGYRERVVSEYANTRLSVLRGAAELWFYTSVEEQAARVTQPVLIVGGRREPLGNENYQRTVTLRSFLSARLEMLDCGHWIPFEEPLALARLIAGSCD